MNEVVVALRAGSLYALIVFGVGFILGTFRVLLAAPHLGETAAVLLEAPIMLVASWYICRWSVHRLDVPRRVPARSMMGSFAFVVLMLAELALAELVFGRSTAEQFSAYATRASAIGPVAQVIFAVFPVIQVWRR